MGWIIFIWVLFMAKLLCSITDIDYLENNTNDYYYEYLYFIFYYTISWNIFEFNNIFQIYNQPTSFWTKLESQFVRLQLSQFNLSATYTAQQSMDISSDIHNIYKINHKTSPMSALEKYIEIDATDDNFNYSYSDLHQISLEYSKPVVFRNFIPSTYIDDNPDLLTDMLNKYGNQAVPVMWNKDQKSIRFNINSIT